MKTLHRKFSRALALALIAVMGLTPGLSVPAFASSHMDAPLITRDPSANTTDVYAFVRPDAAGAKSLVLALGVYPHQNPGIGPNKYNFDDNVRYEIHVALGSDIAAGGNLLLLSANGDQRVDVTDALYVLNFLFLGGPPPALGAGCAVIEGCPALCSP